MIISFLCLKDEGWLATQGATIARELFGASSGFRVEWCTAGRV